MTAKALRVQSIDILRGMVMVVMALDHVRDYFYPGAWTNDPTDLKTTTAALFMTRFVTHFCAPVFVFLAGTSARLSSINGKPKNKLSFFLFTRGLWLILLEITFVTFGWTFSPGFETIFLQVIWAIGWSMVALSILIYIPNRLLPFFGLAIVLFHNLLDGIRLNLTDPGYTFWCFLHQPGSIKLFGGHTELVFLYPVLPWIGLMVCGYCFGTLFHHNISVEKRGKIFILLGILLTLAFVGLRFMNVYGDPEPWSVQKNTTFTILSFLKLTKYPPSLLFILATLGPAIIMLGFLEKGSEKVFRFFHTIGRVPLFYYILHIYLIHLMAVIVRSVAPDVLEYGLSTVYIAWGGVVLLLYPFCSMYNRYKSRNKSVLLSYL